MTFVRFMDCVRYEGKMGLITSMLVESASAVLHLLIFLAFFWAGTAAAFCFAFGSDNTHFSTIPQSFLALFFYGFGIEVFDYEHLTLTHPILAPILFPVYLVFCALVLFNVFIAVRTVQARAGCVCLCLQVIMDAYNAVRDDRKMQYSVFQEAQEGFGRRRKMLRELCCPGGSAIARAPPHADVDELIGVLEEIDGEEMLSYASLQKHLGRSMTSRTDDMVRELHPSLANVAPLTDDYLKDSAHSMDINMSRLSRQQMQHETGHEIKTEAEHEIMSVFKS